MIKSTMPLGEDNLGIIRFQESKDISAACNIKIPTVAGAVACGPEHVARCRGILIGKRGIG